MINATQNNAAGQHPDERPACPSWCAEEDCQRGHRGKARGTVASAGLPPIVDSIDPPSYDTLLVRPEFHEADNLPRGVALFGSNRGEDYEVALTIDEAREVARALMAAADTAESR